jgi:hypothetical protein
MFRPCLETLEKRDLLSAAPVAAVQPPIGETAGMQHSVTAINIDYTPVKTYRDDVVGWDFLSKKNQDIEVENDETHWFRNGGSYPSTNALHAAFRSGVTAGDAIMLTTGNALAGPSAAITINGSRTEDVRVGAHVMEEEGLYW